MQAIELDLDKMDMELLPNDKTKEQPGEGQENQGPRSSNNVEFLTYLTRVPA